MIQYQSISVGISRYRSISFGIIRYQSVSIGIIQYHQNSPQSATILKLPVQLAEVWRPSAANTSSHACGQCLLGVVQHVSKELVLQDALAHCLSAGREVGVVAVLQDVGVRSELRARVVDVVTPCLACTCGGENRSPARFFSISNCSCLRASSLFFSTFIIFTLSALDISLPAASNVCWSSAILFIWSMSLTTTGGFSIFSLSAGWQQMREMR